MPGAGLLQEALDLGPHGVTRVLDLEDGALTAFDDEDLGVSDRRELGSDLLDRPDRRHVGAADLRGDIVVDDVLELERRQHPTARERADDDRGSRTGDDDADPPQHGPTRDGRPPSSIVPQACHCQCRAKQQDL